MKNVKLIFSSSSFGNAVENYEKNINLKCLKSIMKRYRRKQLAIAVFEDPDRDLSGKNVPSGSALRYTDTCVVQILRIPHPATCPSPTAVPKIGWAKIKPL